MKKAERNLLASIALCSKEQGTRYPGMLKDAVPSNLAKRLFQNGLIDDYVPWNPVHKPRWIVTEAGRRALAVNV